MEYLPPAILRWLDGRIVTSYFRTAARCSSLLQDPYSQHLIEYYAQDYLIALTVCIESPDMSLL